MSFSNILTNDQFLLKHLDCCIYNGSFQASLIELGYSNYFESKIKEINFYKSNKINNQGSLLLYIMIKQINSYDFFMAIDYYELLDDYFEFCINCKCPTFLQRHIAPELIIFKYSDNITKKIIYDFAKNKKCYYEIIWTQNNNHHKFDDYAVIKNYLDIHELEKQYKVHNMFHRFNGPANLFIKNNIEEQIIYMFLNQKIPENVITFNNGIPNKELNQVSVLEAMLFDRTYGEIVNIVYKTQKILSEEEIYEILKSKGLVNVIYTYL